MMSSVRLPDVANLAVPTTLIVISHIKPPVRRNLTRVSSCRLAKRNEETGERAMEGDAQADREEAKV